MTKSLILFKEKITEAFNAEKKIILFNIGTDRVILDTFGPMLGSYLENRLTNIEIYGTLENPIHALNLSKQIASVYEKYDNNIFVIATDACVSKNIDTVGNINFNLSAVHPGAGAGKVLPRIGDISICGVTSTPKSKSELLSNHLNNGRLGDVYKMIQEAANVLISIDMQLEK